MAINIVQLLKDHPELVLFVLLALAYLIGNIRIGSLELGAPPGMLIAGLIFGHFGFNVFEGIETIGLFFFLYAVAFQAGPAFFNVVLADGTKYITMGAIATVVGFVLTYLFAMVFQFDAGTAAGLLAGSLTSPAGVAAAIETAPSPEMIPQISISYAITYLIGDISVLLLARNIPKLFRFDLIAQSKKAAAEKHVNEGEDSNPNSWTLTLRVYQVSNPSLVGKTILDLQKIVDCLVLRYKTGGLVTEFDPETRLQKGDRLLIWGSIEQQDVLDQLFGAEVGDAELLAMKIISQDITINKEKAIGKTVRQLGIHDEHACHITKITRSGIDLGIHPELVINRGDVLAISGPQSNLEKLSKSLGYTERDVNATDLVTFAGGVVAGFMLGQINIEIGGIQIGLGSAGGLLFVGILLGYLRSIHPTFGRVPPATIWIFKELGLLFFLAGVGVEAGHGFVEAMGSLGLPIVLSSLVIATAPVLVVFLYGIYVLKMNPALLLGATTGAVTCTPAMAAVSADARSSIPTIGYAGTYAFATIFSAIASSLMTLI
ncbi:aspartate:alanine exchanger family transporter [Gloeocapsa sp. PCC 73106]|uniref:aspartate:alanine exchanger family transporter n=1 Tax=Gloeocapsa sp. PCC 73106 TaxID=102232 RepID=UPI0002AC115C|nr:TrkA C-terminal domain-containing protein [Gloeocapsa sp. PCC 73106]ELR99433.1 putative permease [Gloeocapsa sp. PCC 73106]